MASVRPAWHLLTGEYPPRPGGVSDYSRLVAIGLAQRNHEVHVWAPGPERSTQVEESVTVHRSPRFFLPSGILELNQAMDACPGPRRLLLQYVPHAFGLKAMNLPFCTWFASRRQDERWLFVHEAVHPWTPTSRPAEQLLAAVTRVMLRVVTQGVDRVFISIPSWARHLPKHLQERAEWRPVPSTLPAQWDATSVKTLRDELGEGIWLGHFGTYGGALGKLMARLVPSLLQADPQWRLLLLGRGSEKFGQRLQQKHPALSGKWQARDSLAPQELAHHLAACDVLVQPYPDGVSTRRTTTMASLALGLPVLTNTGPLTEPLWKEERSVALVENAKAETFQHGITQLLAHPSELKQLGQRAMASYQRHFVLDRTLDALTEEALPAGPRLVLAKQ